MVITNDLTYVFDSGVKLYNKNSQLNSIIRISINIDS